MSMIGSARRAGALAALAGLGILGLTAAPAATVQAAADRSGTRLAAAVHAATADAATAHAATEHAAAVAAATAHAATAANVAGADGSAAAVPAGARFVTSPRPAATASGVRQACATPARPGQMMCMALVRAGAPPAQDAAAPAIASRDTASPDGAVPAAGPPPGAYDPADLQEAYGLTSASASAGGGQTVAIVDAHGDPHARKDLAAYRARYGLPACTSPPAGAGCLRITNQAGHVAPLPAPDPSGGWELEESLDLDMVSAICPNCGILLVEAKSATIFELAAAERYAARKASVVSNSWGSGAEFTGENSFDADFRQSGVAIVAAAGDSGYGTQYPAASPFVTAAGGTTLTGATSSHPGTQRAWAGTGSGCSSLEPRPSWQTSADLPRGGCRNRAETDVSAEANPVPGVAVFDTFGADDIAAGWTAAGGTSVSTPIIASVYALAGSVLRGTYPSSYPYLDSSAVADVTSGSDGRCELSRPYLCHARAGYDGPTGLGTPSGTISFGAPAGLAVTVADPGTRDYQAGSAVRLRVRAIDSGQNGLRYSSKGLPAGLRLDPADGVISGRLPGQPGTRSVRITATDAAGGSGSVTFAIVVVARIADRHPGSGPIRLHLADRCLTDTGDSAARGTRIGISACDGRPGQDWEYIPLASPGAPGLVQIHGKCLSIHSGTRAGARATLQPCDGSGGQKWAYQPPGHLYNPNSARCLAAPGTSRSGGTQAELRSCSSAAGQSWMLPPGPVLSGISGKCLADPGASASPGTRIEIAACTAGSSQKWVLEPGGTLRIRGKCLNVSRGGLKDGAPAELSDCSVSASEQWSRGPDGELLNGNSGRCLADPANKTAGGTRLVQEDCYGEPGEIWAIS